MMKYHLNLLILALLFSAGLSTGVSAQGIEFYHGSWDELLKEAQKQNKPFFVDCFTTWCGPCKKMSNEIFPQQSVGDFYNKNFLAYKLDMEKGDGPAVAKKYQIGFYPTFLYFSSKGELMHKTMGAKDAERFIQDGINALDSNKSVFGMVKRFRRGEKDTTFLWNLIVATQDIDPKAQMDALAIYWKAVPKERLIDDKQWHLFTVFEHDVASEKFQYVLSHLEEFNEKYGKNTVENVIFSKCAAAMQDATAKNDEKAFRQAYDIMSKAENKDAQKFAAYADLIFYKTRKDWATMLKKADYFRENFAKGNAKDLNQLAWELTNASDEKKVQKKAEELVNESIKLEKNYQNTFTYANILYKLGKFKDSEATASESMELAKKAGKDSKDIENLMLKARAAQKK